ncbi:hypothetical protein, partial [Duodenibacillus massiliensis]|uniref:hypothetical protein n=1 Tax=Duodenibacillus massiliensis TaxID=1852381 RepID=UPI00307784C9
VHQKSVSKIYFLSRGKLPSTVFGRGSNAFGRPGETGLSSATLVAFLPEDEGGRSRTISAPKEKYHRKSLAFQSPVLRLPRSFSILG